MLYSSSTTSRSGSTGHAIGFELHHGGKLVARHALEVAGIVGGGEGILVAADPQHGLRELAGRMLGRALEHQVLEEMRQAGFARRLVGRADLVPDHLGDHRRAVIGDHDDLQAIIEREAGGTCRRDRGLGVKATTEERECGDQRGKQKGNRSA
jgi:hypothetical protein